MSDFEFLFTFFGLLLGLTVAEVALRFADAIDAHERRPMGLLTPLLATFVLVDIAGFWLWTWSARDILQVSWGTVYCGLAIAITYFLSASLIFPRSDGRWVRLDDHYWARKRLVIGGILAVNIAIFAAQLTRQLPHWNDWWFYYYQLAYFVPLVGLWFTRGRKADIALLCFLLVYFLTAGFDLMGASQWGSDVGLGNPASTSRVPASR